MTHRLTIDRFEGPANSTAVLVVADGRPIDFPADLLPTGAKAGDVLMLALAIDANATARDSRAGVAGRPPEAPGGG